MSRAGRNKTIELTAADRRSLRPRLVRDLSGHDAATFPSGTACGDCLDLIEHMPAAAVDLLILDPPYNLNKTFHGRRFGRTSVAAYTEWLDERLSRLERLLKPTATVYICGDWRSSASIYEAAARHFIVRNRISWEREKGRGARKNWKNASEDIWFCTVSGEYTFNLDAVRLRRRVLAPYRDDEGTPKDWQRTAGGDFRDTAPSNLWTDITIPFWSMPENTDHPTQKSEKLLAKLILAGSNPGDLVFDPYLGSGTTSVVAKKLGRRYLGIDIDEDFCLLAEKRLEHAEVASTIQGYEDGVFWERNTRAATRRSKAVPRATKSKLSLPRRSRCT